MRGRGRKAPNPLTRTYESNGPDVKIRGTALHIAEKYQQLARDAQASGDRITSENYYQHAEHYQRIVAAAQPQHSQTTAAPYARSEDETASEAPKAAVANEEKEAAGTATSSTQPIVGLDTPQPFIETASTVDENTEAVVSTVDSSEEDDDKPRRRVRGTRGRGVRRAPSSASSEAPSEASEGGEEDAAAPKPRRTPRARTPRAARTQRSRSARVPSEDAPAPTALETTGDGEG
ncbi:hypothetical protein GCM10007094_17140 [Pseudovibrio japonicus]|uniref:DUF4167 domain-containing protein n=2 Tax=Pseudovibrio japonicus TaxID=366534 RepID=A0ABQ3EAX4_9HYPH|nr:hypothetical protein GCM10007094_17140 [Pseudovibrio japonicus]